MLSCFESRLTYDRVWHNHSLIALKSFLLGYIFTSLNLARELLSLKGWLFCQMWRVWRSITTWKCNGCQCSLLQRRHKHNTSHSLCKCRQINQHVRPPMPTSLFCFVSILSWHFFIYIWKKIPLFELLHGLTKMVQAENINVSILLKLWS